MSQSQASRQRLDRRLSIAPMLDWTDRHYRVFARNITRHTLLYTEMVTTGAILHGDRERHLGFCDQEHPIALQLGGSDPGELAQCARIGEGYGYDEINLNVGCPSDKVQSGMFGACLMKTPDLVGDCVAAMADAVSIPVTVKHRIGVDERDSYPELTDFVAKLAERGCRVFIVHARKAWLSGLSPKENREVPPLRYDLAAALKRDFPELEIILNGGIQSLDQAREWIGPVDGVMIGRAAYHDPWLLHRADAEIFGEKPPAQSRPEVARAMLPYLEELHAAGQPVNRVTRHMLGLYHACPGARKWRRALGEGSCRKGAGPEILEQALEEVERAAALAADH